MASVLKSLICVVQISLSAYGLYVDSISIRNLQGYEEKSKQAAEWSSTAAQQLHKTRTTQTSGTVATLLSCISAISLLFIRGRFTTFAVAATNVAALLLAHEHVGAFWKGKAKVPLPGVGDYNEAISKTQEGRLNMAYLAASWIVSGLVALVL